MYIKISNTYYTTMSGSGTCSYFILQKPNNTNIGNDDENKFITIDTNRYNTSTSKNIYILPYNNLDYYKNYGLFEKNLIEWSKQFCSTDKNMLDIGAHTGTYAISLAHLCDKVYAFEPQQMTYYSLCGSVALSNIQNINCMKYGLGSESQVGLHTLHIVSDDGGGSTLHSGSNTNVLKTETIEVKTLDRFNITNISFIKMDVEDNELNVLLGSLNTLKNSNYPKILFESNTYNEKLFNFLKDLKYNVVPINGFSNMFLASI
jgi:FkbM family methyltransferase